MSKKVKIESDAILNDILERLRKLDERLDAIENEISGVKKTMKVINTIAKVAGFIITSTIAIWNIVCRILPKGHGR